MATKEVNRITELNGSAPPTAETTPDDMAPSLGNRSPVPKVEKYRWRMVGQPGRFAWIPKNQLYVDHEYQRTKVSESKVLAIAAEWVWPAVAALSVAARPDGTYWVFDGQHRKLAADKRSDIQALPCMVFDMGDKLQEALSFLRINSFRAAVHAIDKFNAELIAQDPIAVAARQMIEASGYRIGNTSGHHATSSSAATVKCIGTIKRAIQQNPTCAQTAWGLCVELFQGRTVNEDLFRGLFQVELLLARSKAGSLLNENNRSALLRHSVTEITQAMNESKAFRGGGPKACAEGIVRLLNKGRRSRRLPNPYGEADDASE
jgi:hypothetical protein